MRFRTILVVSDVAIREDTQITLSYQSTHPITIAIEKDDVGDRRSATVTAVTQFDADRYQAVFAALEAGRLPHDAKPYMAGDTLVQPGEPLNGYIPDPGVLPEAFQPMTAQVARELSDTAQRSWRVLHWRHNISASRSMFSSRGTHWAWDTDTGSWHPVPLRGSGVADALQGVPAHAAAGIETEALLRAGIVPPLAYEMLQEARDLQATAGRASLAIAIAALETGIKAFIADLVPDAKWLAQEVPSPPVVKLLREYIRGLPVRLQVNGKTLPPPDRVLNQLRDAVSKRNQLTHRGVNRVDGQFLKETIYAVSDCLRLLDYYSGHSWALNWLSWETMQDLHVAPRR